MTRMALLLLLGSSLALTGLLSGCAGRSVGAAGSWELFRSERRSSWHRLAETGRLLEGGNDWSDVRETARQITAGPKGGFGVIAHDLGKTFAPPFSFHDLRVTLNLLR